MAVKIFAIPALIVAALFASTLQVVSPFGPTPQIGQGFTQRLVAGLWSLAALAVEHPIPLAVVLGVWVLRQLVVAIRRAIPANKDPQRMFTTAQRVEAFRISQGRCEFDGFWPFSRCGRPAAHADHWFPHTLGGASSMNNLVSGCAPCNLSKGAKVPTFWQTTRIERRRRSYFPPGVPLRPGEKYLR